MPEKQRKNVGNIRQNRSIQDYFSFEAKLKENLFIPQQNIERVQNERLNFSAFRAILQAGGRIIFLFPPTEGQSPSQYIKNHTKDILDDCQFYQGISVKQDEIERTGKVIEKFTESYDIPEGSVEKYVWTIWKSCLGFSGENFEDFFQKKHKYITRMILNAHLKTSLQEISIETLRRRKLREPKPLDHISALGSDDPGFIEVEENEILGEESENPMNKVREKIDKLPSKTYREIIYAKLSGDNETLVKFSQTVIDDAFRVFWDICYGNGASQNTPYDETKTFKRRTKSGSMNNLREQILQKVGSFSELFYLISLLKTDTHEHALEPMTLLHACGYFHSDERLEIFALNEGVSEEVLRRIFNNGIERTKSLLGIPHQDIQISTYIEDLEIISIEKRRGANRFNLPKTPEERLGTLYKVIEENSKKAERAIINRKTSNRRHEIILSIIEDHKIVGRMLTLDELYDLTEKMLISEDLPLWKEKRWFYDDIISMIVKIKSFTLPIIDESSQKQLRIIDVVPSEGQLAIIGSQAQLLETYKKSISQDKKERSNVDRRIRMYVSAILGIETLDCLYKQPRKQHRNIRLLLQILGMKIGLPKEIYGDVTKVSEILKNIKSTCEEKTTEELVVFASQIGCTPEILQEILSPSIYFYRFGQGKEVSRRQKIASSEVL